MKALFILLFLPVMIVIGSCSTSKKKLPFCTQEYLEEKISKNSSYHFRCHNMRVKIHRTLEINKDDFIFDGGDKLILVWVGPGQCDQIAGKDPIIRINGNYNIIRRLRIYNSPFGIDISSGTNNRIEQVTFPNVCERAITVGKKGAKEFPEKTVISDTTFYNAETVAIENFGGRTFLEKDLFINAEIPLMSWGTSRIEVNKTIFYGGEDFYKDAEKYKSGKRDYDYRPHYDEYKHNEDDDRYHLKLYNPEFDKAHYDHDEKYLRKPKKEKMRSVTDKFKGRIYDRYYERLIYTPDGENYRFARDSYYCLHGILAKEKSYLKIYQSKFVGCVNSISLIDYSRIKEKRNIFYNFQRKIYKRMHPKEVDRRELKQHHHKKINHEKPFNSF